MGWVGCLAGSRVVECMHPGGHVVPAWAPVAAWSFMRAVEAAWVAPSPRLPLYPPGLAPLPPPPLTPPLTPASAQAAQLLGLVAILLVVAACLGGACWSCRRYCRRSAHRRQRQRAHMMLDDSAQLQAQTQTSTGSQVVTTCSPTPPLARTGSESSMFSVSIEMASGSETQTTPGPKAGTPAARRTAARIDSAPSSLIPS